VYEIECVKVWIIQVQETKKEREFLSKFSPSLIKRKSGMCGVTLCVCILLRCVFNC
jgi:hypothetical protein